MKKKKAAAALLCILLMLAATGCSLGQQQPAVMPTPAPTASPVPESSLESSESAEPESSKESSETPPSEAPSGETSSEISPEGAEAEISDLPPVAGDPAFVEVFAGNEIDAVYLDTMEKAVSVADMTQAANAATAAWETQINYAFTQLTDALEGEAKENEVLEQSAWSNELGIAKKEITDSAEGQGSAANLDVSYKIMLLYRSRAIAIFEKLYVVTGKVDFHQITGEAVG